MALDVISATARPQPSADHPDLRVWQTPPFRHNSPYIGRFAFLMWWRSVTAGPPPSDGYPAVRLAAVAARRNSCQRGLPGGPRDIRGDNIGGVPVAVQGEQGYQRMLKCRAEPGGHQEGAGLVAVQGGGVRLIIHPRAADMRVLPVDPASVAGPAALPGRSGLLGAGLGEGAARPQVGAGAVVVEDAQHLRRSVPRSERVRLHRGELGRLAGPDEDGPLAQPQHDGAGQDGEPVPARVDAQPGGHLPGHPQFRDRHALRRTGPRQQPGRHAPCLVLERPDHHVGVVVGLHQLVKRGAQCPRDRRELIQGNPPVTGLDPA
jgi:hypothetical protein